MTVNSLRYPHYQKTNYDPLRDFTYIIGLSNFTFAVAVLADSPWKTIEDLIAAGKAQPGKLSSGDGAAFAPLADEGRVRILALATETPMARFKGVPTLREKGIDAVGWSPYGIIGPKSMPAEVIRAVHDAFKQAMDDPAHDAFLEKFIQVSWYKNPAEYRAWAEKYFVDIQPALAKAGLLKR
jgi:tripartite-type tricarboxylate transporter receptor subunit TctC